MSASKQLSKRQSAVIEDLLTLDLEEQKILEKHHVTRREYDRWLTDERFTSRIERRITEACRRSRIILARNAVTAANTLVKLAQGEKGETARKACLDIISLHAGQGPSVGGGIHEPSASPAACGLTPEMVSRLLAALAQGSQDITDSSLPRQ